MLLADYTFRFAPRVATTLSACYTRLYVAKATSQAGRLRLCSQCVLHTPIRC